MRLAIVLLMFGFFCAPASAQNADELFDKLLGQALRHQNEALDIQRYLSQLGYYDGPIDGVLGQATQQAILKFQRDQGLQETGRLRKSERKLLRRLARAATTSGTAERLVAQTPSNKMKPDDHPKDSTYITAQNVRFDSHDCALAERAEKLIAELEAVGFPRDKIFYGMVGPNCGVFPGQVSEMAFQLRQYKQKLADAENREIAITKRDNSDVIAQVLNYSSTGQDEGTDKSFWYKEEYCIYRSTNNEVISFAEINPELLRFEIRHTELGLVTAVFYNEKAVTASPGQLNLERLERGWRLIFEKHCKGKISNF